MMETSEINIRIADLAHREHLTLEEAAIQIEKEDEAERWDTDYVPTNLVTH